MSRKRRCSLRETCVGRHTPSWCSLILGSSPVCSALAMSTASRCLMSRDRRLSIREWRRGGILPWSRVYTVQGVNNVRTTVLATLSTSLRLG